MRRPAVRRALALLLAAAVVLTAGCTTSRRTTAEARPPAASASTASTSAAPMPPPAPVSPPSVCDLLTAQDVAAMLGAGMTGHVVKLIPQFAMCEYKATDGRVAQLLVSTGDIAGKSAATTATLLKMTPMPGLGDKAWSETHRWRRQGMFAVSAVQGSVDCLAQAGGPHAGPAALIPQLAAVCRKVFAVWPGSR